MLGLGNTLTTSQAIMPSFQLSSVSQSANWIQYYTPVLSGASTGVSSSYFLFTGYANLSENFNSNVLNADTGATMDMTITNVALGTTASFNSLTVYGSGSGDSFKVSFDQALLDSSSFDNIRSATSGENTEILFNAALASAAQTDNTAIDLSFSGSFSNSFEIAYTITGVNGETAFADSSNPFGSAFNNNLAGSDLFFPVRATNSSGSSVETDAYCTVVLTNTTESVSITISDVPLWLDSDDTFNLRDKNGALLNITGDFVHTNSSGTDVTTDMTPLDGSLDYVSMALSEDVEGAEANRSISLNVFVS